MGANSLRSFPVVLTGATRVRNRRRRRKRREAEKGAVPDTRIDAADTLPAPGIGEQAAERIER